MKLIIFMMLFSFQIFALTVAQQQNVGKVTQIINALPSSQNLTSLHSELCPGPPGTDPQYCQTGYICISVGTQRCIAPPNASTMVNLQNIVYNPTATPKSCTIPGFTYSFRECEKIYLRLTASANNQQETPPTGDDPGGEPGPGGN